MMPSSQLRKLWFREGREQAYGHTAGRQQSWDRLPDLSVPMVLTPGFAAFIG